MRRTAITTLLLAATAAPPAAAQDGVFVDPNSPAGVEYAIPLDEARREAAGGSRDGGGDPSRGQPLFGKGITRVEGSGSQRAEGSSDQGGSREGGGAVGGAASTDGRGRQQGEGGDDALPDPRDVPPSVAGSAAIEAATSDGSDGLLTAGIAAAVLAAGLAAGFGLRRVLKGR